MGRLAVPPKRYHIKDHPTNSNTNNNTPNKTVSSHPHVMQSKLSIHIDSK